MIAVEMKTVALFGNPNSGKSSLFNQLTGLRQKVGNFPGVTVDRKAGLLQLPDNQIVQLIDFPGTYSVYPNSLDERVVAINLCDPDNKDYPDAVIYVADITHLEKHLLFFTQLLDLGLPMLLMLSMNDLAEREGIEVDVKQLSKTLGIQVLQFDGRAKNQHEELKLALHELLNQEKTSSKPFYVLSKLEKEVVQEIRSETAIQNDYHALLLAHHHDWLPNLSSSSKNNIQRITTQSNFESIKHQIQETLQRFDRFSPIVNRVISTKEENKTFTDSLDRILTHRLWGVLIFFTLMLLVFQAIFAWAGYPMDSIEATFGWLGEQVESTLPDNWFRSLLVDGILAGLAGVLVFIPQIAILFFLIALLEEVGYMARAVYLFDRVMQRFGMNGRSLVALISGGACAIPAIMSTRTISNWKERLITILVTPFISCSARIPVYIVLVAFVVPTGKWLFISWQAWAFMGLYLLGIVTALASAWVLKKVLKAESHSFLMLELPKYRPPRILDVFLTVWDKVKSFILEAGKIILLISVILWFLASYGPSQQMQVAEQEAIELAEQQNLDEQAKKNFIAAKKIEHSYAGILGKTIEPVIRPLGFDWKIGIALITSFAAREVFVGTMATIYSIGSEDDEYKIQERMAKERDVLTGKPIYTLATSLSLLIFYVLAMQCVSTLAVVRKETNSWKWPILQFVAMTAMAYLGSLFVYQLLA